MDSFSLLKYWRGGGGGGGGGGATTTTTLRSTAAAAVSGGVTTIAAAALRQEPESEDDDARSADDDDGPFIDLEFTVPDEDDEVVAEGEERELDFALGSDADPSLSLSPSDSLFFKGKLLPLDRSSLVFHSSKHHQFLHKIRVFALGLKKTRSSSSTPKQSTTTTNSKSNGKPFTVKLKVEEVPIASLFSRDNSSRSSASAGGSSNGRGAPPAKAPPQVEDGMEERRSSKELVNKYLNKIKPLYVKVSKKHNEKLRSPTTTTKVGEVQVKAAPVQAAATGPGSSAHLPTGLRVVCKHLGKSRSASSAVAAAAVTSPPAGVKRRDDSLLQQQDGIQSAIAHCKRSFNGTRDGESPLGRSRSDSYDERSNTDKSKSREED